MSKTRLEDQIRNYTEAWYSEVRPIQEIASEAEASEQLISGQVTVTVPRTRDHSPAWKGLAIAFGAALVVLLIALPLLLTGGEGQPEPAATTSPIAPTTTVLVPDNPFLGVWTGDDDLDGSRVTVIVEEDAVIYQETAATACKTAFDQFVGGQAQGHPTLDGNTLTFTGTFYCNLEEGRTPHPTFEEAEWVFSYDPQTDTMTLNHDPTTIMSR